MLPAQATGTPHHNGNIYIAQVAGWNKFFPGFTHVYACRSHRALPCSLLPRSVRLFVCPFVTTRWTWWENENLSAQHGGGLGRLGGSTVTLRYRSVALQLALYFGRHWQTERSGFFSLAGYVCVCVCISLVKRI